MKVGIITMYKVLNYGSALQAYALQRKLFEMGVDNEIIDYQYPKPIKKKTTMKSLISQAIIFARNAIIGFPTEKKKKKFEEFYEKNFVLSPQSYDEDSIKQNPPQYDIYLTGSDQVWNPRFAGNDTNFMLSFVSEGQKRISFASSFATNHIDEEKRGLYAKYLSMYDAISVRETSGVDIVRELTGKSAEVCCDPTLLLDKSEWDKLAEQSSIKIGEKYILVYILSYMCDVYPQVDNLIASVQKILGLKVIYLVGRKEDAFKPNSRLIKSAGPAEFAYLFQNAEFVITTSFHGTAFSLINDKPLLGVVNKDNDSDSRIQSLLCNAGAEKSITDYHEVISKSKDELFSLCGQQELIKQLKQSSVEYLQKQFV